MLKRVLLRLHWPENNWLSIKTKTNCPLQIAREYTSVAGTALLQLHSCDNTPVAYETCCWFGQPQCSLAVTMYRLQTSWRIQPQRSLAVIMYGLDFLMHTTTATKTAAGGHRVNLKAMLQVWGQNLKAMLQVWRQNLKAMLQVWGHMQTDIIIIL